MPRRKDHMVAALIRTAFVQESQWQALGQWREGAEKVWKRFPRLAAVIDAAEHDVLAYMAFHEKHWAQIASTNPLQRVNKEIK